MKLANCSRCNRVYTSVPGGRDICQSCMREEDDNYRKIFNFLSTRPAATAQEIAQATDIDVKDIYRYVRENRLRLVQGDTGLTCEGCGIPIAQGKICDKCRQKLSEDLKNDIDKSRPLKPQNPSGRREEPPDPKYLKDRRG